MSMPRDPAVLAAPHARFELPKYDEIALVLQGGGALGSYQAGVYEGLSERGVEPTWIAGISIGALNTAILAGNAPEDRVEALKGFWNTITKPNDAVGLGGAWILRAFGFDAAARGWASGWSAMRAVLEGPRGGALDQVPDHHRQADAGQGYRRLRLR
jgi:NTE family protein